MSLELGISYYGNRIPWRVQEDLRAIQESGCTYVLHTFSEEDVEFYQGAVAEIAELTRKAGLKVWLDPWGVGQIFGGETYSNLIATNLSVRQMSSEGQSLPIACINHPALKEYLHHWITAAARAKPDVLFWDEPHFKIYPEPGGAPPKTWACRCPICEARFKKLTGSAMPKEFDPQVQAFKEDSLVELTRWLCDETRARGIRPAVCLLPFENSSTVNDWEKIAAIDSLEIIGTDPYWKPHQPEVDKHVGRFSKRIAELARRHKKEGQIWILNFNIPKGEEGTIRTAIDAAYQEGIRNFAAWSYYGASYIRLRAEDPPAVWKTLSDCYHQLKKQ